MNLTLIRDTASPHYVQGVMQAGTLRLQTLELPWVPFEGGYGGHPQQSCVPAGTFALVLHDTQKHPHAFALMNPALDIYHEPGDIPPERAPYARCAILIHSANTPGELLGCIGVGLERAPGFIVHSLLALSQFEQTVPWMPGHTLVISYADGASP